MHRVRQPARLLLLHACWNMHQRCGECQSCSWSSGCAHGVVSASAASHLHGCMVEKLGWPEQAGVRQSAVLTAHGSAAECAGCCTGVMT
jgi:hypothetical protein